MKSIHAFAIVCLLPLSVLTAVGIAAATSIPTGGAREASASSSAAAAAPLPWDAQDPAPGAAPAPAQATEEEGLHEHMETLQSGMKEMRRMLGKAESKADLLTLVAKLQLAARACFDLLPEQVTPITDPTAHAEWRIGYVRRMVEVYDTLLQLELAAHQGDGNKMKELYKKLGEQKQSGHDAFQAE